MLLLLNKPLGASPVSLPKVIAKDDGKIESFLAAMDRNDFEQAETIVYTMNKSCLNRKIRHGETPLIMSIVSGSSSTLTKAIISRGVDINMTDIGGASPLHIAVRMNKSDVVKLLVLSGAKVNLRDELGYTPLMRAALRCDVNIISVLMQQNRTSAVDLAIKNRKGETAYDLSSHCKDEKVRNMLQVRRVG